MEPVNTQISRPVALPGAEIQGYGPPGELQCRDIEPPVPAPGKNALPGALLFTDRRFSGKQSSLLAAPPLLLPYQTDANEFDIT